MAHKRECASVILPKMNSGIELMDKLNIKVTFDRHELNQVKLFTKSQCLPKVLQVAPPVIKINCRLLGKPVLVVFKHLMNNPYLHLIPVLNIGPTGCNRNQVRI